MMNIFLKLLDDKEDKEEKTEKIVTATKKVSAVLDQYLPQHIKSSYHVLQVVCSFP
jgi:poly [ADP-ribose] polymerase 2/3/4